MAALFTMKEVLEATGGRGVGLTADTIGSVSIDSRAIEPGALFVAIRGERFDGHDFVPAALKAGAAAAMVTEGRQVDAASGLIVVPDALDGLVALGRAARTRMEGRVVAVTGSAGKTTTREAIRTVLACAGPTHASIRSFNNQWGVPLMLARMPRDTRFGVFEIGMNHAGEITPLTLLVRPHVAVVTTVAAAHLEFFDSVAAIARAKAEIFLGLEPGGTAVVNIDHPYVDVLLEAAREAGVRHIVTYGAGPTADWRIDAVSPRGEETLVTVRHDGVDHALKLGVPGRHMAANAVAALAVGELCGVPASRAIEALGRFLPPEGRGVVLRLGPADRPLTLIDESYNANSASMAAALETFAAHSPPGGRKVLVLGDMLELGAAAPELHRALAGPVRASGADLVYLVGEEMAALAEALGPTVAAHARTVADVNEAVLNLLAYGDLIMVKGSNGVHLGTLVEAIRSRFG